MEKVGFKDNGLFPAQTQLHGLGRWSVFWLGMVESESQGAEVNYCHPKDKEYQVTVDFHIQTLGVFVATRRLASHYLEREFTSYI